MGPYITGTVGCGCGCDDRCGLERVRFFPRQLLGADDLMAEQRYFREKQRRHNRYLHGWGVVCGAEVRPAPTATKPYQVLICPGYLVTPLGDEIMIGAPALFDLATCMVNSDDPCAFARPCPPVTTHTPMRKTIYLAVCYKECEVRPVRVAPAGCGCDEVQCDYSRIRDAYEFSCLDCPPETVQQDCEELCRGGIVPCPACPKDNCVVLATIRIRGSFTPGLLGRDVDAHALAAAPAGHLPGAGPLTIDNLTHRKALYSTAMLQAMAMCQCGEQPHRPVAAPPDIHVTHGQERNMIVTITDTTPGATIHFTIDGTEPTSSSTVYSGQIVFSHQAFAGGTLPVVKAMATAPGHDDSPVSSVRVPKP